MFVHPHYLFPPPPPTHTCLVPPPSTLPHAEVLDYIDAHVSMAYQGKWSEYQHNSYLSCGRTGRRSTRLDCPDNLHSCSSQCSQPSDRNLQQKTSDVDYPANPKTSAMPIQARYTCSLTLNQALPLRKNFNYHERGQADCYPLMQVHLKIFL